MKCICKRIAACLLFSVVLTLSSAGAEEWVDIIKPGAALESFQKPTAKWAEYGNTALKAEKPKHLSAEPGMGVVFNGGVTKNLVTKVEHGDALIEIEFMVPKGANSGVYVQGRYELQVFDSWEKKEVEHSTCGGIYKRWLEDKGWFEGKAPLVNASKPPGEWQKFEITFKAPRFDAEGNKTANATFVKVLLNGVVIHENAEVTGWTRSAAFKDEKPKGPIMLQGYKSPVAYRNFRIKHLNLK